MLNTISLVPAAGNGRHHTAELTNPYSYTAAGAVDKIDYRGSKDADYAYTIRDWVESINSVGTPNGNFAASYNYADNGNVSKAELYNPQIQSGGGTNGIPKGFRFNSPLERLLDEMSLVLEAAAFRKLLTYSAICSVN